MVFQKRNFLSEFEAIHRQQGESLRTFTNRYRRAERNLRAVGIEVALIYDSDSRGNRLLERARHQRLILVGSRYSLGFDEIAESMHMQHPEFKQAPAVCGRAHPEEGRRQVLRHFDHGSSSTQAASSSSSSSTNSSFNGKGNGRRVYITEHQDGTLSDVPEEGGDAQEELQAGEDVEATENQPSPHAQKTDAGSDESLGLGEVAEVLTVTAKKLTGLKLGRKFSAAPRKDVASLQKEPHCAVCGQKGHWKGNPECPASSKETSSLSSTTRPTSALGKGKSHDQANKGRRTPRGYGSVEISDGRNFSSILQANAVLNVMDAPGLDSNFLG